MLRDRDVLDHVDGDPQPVAVQRADHVARDAGATHAAQDDRAHAGGVGQRLGGMADRVAAAALVPEPEDGPQDPGWIGRSDGLGIVEIDQGCGQADGFSASSISMTGMSSRTG